MMGSRTRYFGRLLIAIAIHLFTAIAAVASDSPCISRASDPLGPGSIVDARTLRLQDGREIRLVGLEAISTEASDRERARQTLDTLMKGGDLRQSGNAKPDRYGRIPAFVVTSGQNETLQEGMLREGHFAAGLVDDDACMTRLRSLEAEAMSARRGIWAGTSALKNTETPGDILAMVGRFVVAEGKVLSARQAGATFYINIGRQWTRDFAVTIARRDVGTFEKAGVSRLTLEGRTVRVRGWVEQRGCPRIRATKPAQIEIVK